MRKAGILLPISSLPSNYGIGCFSDEAYKFVDFLKSSGQTYWQILPLGPTGYGDSPYQAFSTFAGNPYFISLERLIEEGLLKKETCDSLYFGDNEERIDYSSLYNNRFKILRKAFNNSRHIDSPDYIAFLENNSYWLSDYSLFMSLKNHFGEKDFSSWDEDIRLRKKDLIDEYKVILKEEIEFYNFLQFKFYQQWNKLKNYANKNGIKIIGDLPIYVSSDSADVWTNPELFELDESNIPLKVAGCPPDGFSKEGQLWGNPVYNWNEHKKNNFDWWMSRLSHCFSMYDMLRIDHFRGFDEYYTIKYGNKNAINGKWEKAAGLELFERVKKEFKDKEIIAEDLGFITSSVKELLKFCGFPGMKILQFAFDSRDSSSKNDYLPHNYNVNSVAYTGTHDNQTLQGWFLGIPEKEKKQVRDYLSDYYTPDNEIYKALISLVLMSNSELVIVPLQDYLGLDDRARINTPSTSENNWTWRVSKKYFTDSLAKEIYKKTKLYGRM